MRSLRALFMAFVLSSAAGSSGAGAQQPLVADLSNHLVAITTGFAGAQVLLFGATDKEGDVVVIVRGPSTKITMHRKSRVLGIWINTARMKIRNVPSFYYVAASRPLAEIASGSVLKRHEMGIDNLKLSIPPTLASENIRSEWRAALIRNQRRQGLYAAGQGSVSVLGNRLFRTRLVLPANVSTGTYQVQVFLLRDGQVVSAQTTPLIVSKIGLEADIFYFAHEASAFYGLFAIVLAAVAGWLGNAVFRKG